MSNLAFRNMRNLGAFAALSLIWGTAWIPAAEIDPHCPLLRASADRYAIAAVLLAILAAAKRGPLPSGRVLRASLILGCTMVAMPVLLFSFAGKAVQPGTSAVLFAVAPVALVLLSAAGRGVQAPRRAFYASLIGFAAVTLAISGVFSLTLPGILAGAAEVTGIVLLVWSLDFAKRELQAASVIGSAVIQLAAAAVLTGSLSLIVERGASADWSFASAASLGWLTLICSALALPLFYWLLRRTEPFQLAALWWMQPLLTVTGMAVLFHQPLPLTFYAGSLAALLGVGLLFPDAAERDEQALSLRATGQVDP